MFWNVFKYIFCFVILIFAVYSQDCNMGGFTYKDSKYILSREPRTLYSSKIHCETIGTRLVTIGTVSEYHILQGNNVCEKKFWIGSPNIFNPKTRSVMSSSAIDPDILDNKPLCIILNKGLTVTNCSDKYQSICEKNETRKSLWVEELLNFSLPIDEVSRNCEYLQKNKQKEYVKSNVSVEDLYDKVFNSSDYDPVNVLKQLKNATYACKETNETFQAVRLIKVVKMMTKLAELDLNNSKALAEDRLKPYLDIMSNLVGDHTIYSWIVTINQDFNAPDNANIYIFSPLENAIYAYKENNETIQYDILIKILDIFATQAGVDLNAQNSLTKESLKPFLEIRSNLLGNHTKESWVMIVYQTGNSGYEFSYDFKSITNAEDESGKKACMYVCMYVCMCVCVCVCV
ncbi:uncharacterized protein LOC132719487 [Ruditapes philippinarum]|uniref:uncharacterized protein LOC132719487 n=1 Tax=Ruditapes philippinarum TaxID=129788 RepID=UPI00295BC600|nr:uncharacterized protein LOC132719487 [Ruditapes philippinarum]